MDGSRTSTNRAEELKRALKLELLEDESGCGESGFCAKRNTSEIEIFQDGIPWKAHSSIYYLLDREKPMNFLHWLSPDDTHVLCEGGPVNYFVFSPDGSVESSVLGCDLARGEQPMLLIRGNRWKALELGQDSAFALIASILTPEWREDRVRVGAGPWFIDRYADRDEWATRGFLRKLIGRNFREFESGPDEAS